MEGLKLRVIILSVIMFAFGMWVNLSTKEVFASKTEKEMEKLAPRTFDGYAFTPSRENPEQSYRMDDTTYRRLKPYGIVCRSYYKGDKTFDVVLIASQSRGSFHDPRVCFSAQGYTITNEEASVMDTEARGKVPFTAVTMDSGQAKGALAMYFYRGPGGYYRNVVGLKFAMFKERLMGGKDVDGVFYRIIPGYPGATVDDLKKFAGEYLAAAKPVSGGYF